MGANRSGRYVYGRSTETRLALPPIKEPTPAELKGYDKPLNQTHLLHPKPEPEQTDPIWDLFPET